MTWYVVNLGDTGEYVLVTFPKHIQGVNEYFYCEVKMTKVGEVATVAVSSSAGGISAVTTVAVMGEVAGLSGAGIMSGLASAGGIIGGGAAAGIVVVAAGSALVSYGFYRALNFIFS